MFESAPRIEVKERKVVIIIRQSLFPPAFISLVLINLDGASVRVLQKSVPTRDPLWPSGVPELHNDAPATRNASVSRGSSTWTSTRTAVVGVSDRDHGRVAGPKVP